MHVRRYQNWGRNDLGGNGIGGETTRVWGAKRPKVITEAKRRGETTWGEHLGGETTCYL